MYLVRVMLKAKFWGILILFWGTIVFATPNISTPDFIEQPGYSSEGSIPVVPHFDKVILVPGAGARTGDLYIGHYRWDEYFSAFYSYFEKYGIPFEVHQVSKHGGESVELRVKSLEENILQNVKDGEKVLLVGHSMGGLTSRLVMRNPDVWSKVSAVLQITAVNRGTDLIDFALSSKPLYSMISGVSKLIGFNLKNKHYMPQLSHAITSTDLISEADFQKGMPPIFSIVAMDSHLNLAKENPPLGVTSAVIAGKLKTLPKEEQVKMGEWGTASDGLVPAYSQVWGHCLGVVKAGHLFVIGKTVRSSDQAKFDQYMNWLMHTIKPHACSEALNPEK